jgi:hypothetical protein
MTVQIGALEGDMTVQIVITRQPDGTLRILEMGRNETLREHDLQPEISDVMAARYLANLITDLQSVETK